MSHPLVVNRRHSSFDVYIGRPSIYGNPFSSQTGTLAKFKVDLPEEALEEYEKWVLSQPEFVEQIKKNLKGRVLGCWCAPRKCHGDFLARLANEEPL